MRFYPYLLLRLYFRSDNELDHVIVILAVNVMVELIKAVEFKAKIV